MGVCVMGQRNSLYLQWNLPDRPPIKPKSRLVSPLVKLLLVKLPVSDHLTKIPIGSSVSQIAISETSRKRPPLLSDHLTKVLIGSSVSQIAVRETSRKRPTPVSDHLSLTSRMVAYGRFHCMPLITSTLELLAKLSDFVTYRI